jgi:uncharacterized protein (TIGR02996 family)
VSLPMPDAEAFLRAIIENPDDDAPRLIYADWLDEHGDPDQAEFIRIQCALAARRQEEIHTAPLIVREAELRERHAVEWTPVVPTLTRSLQVSFRRGFVETVSAEARSFVAGADELFRLTPVQNVQLYWGADPPHERARFMQTIAAIPHLARLRSLDLSDSYIGSDGVQALAVCDYLGKLESLNLSGAHAGERGMRALVEASWFGNLTFLDLSNNDVNAVAARALAAGLDALDRAGQLRLHELHLEGNPLRTAGARVIRASRALRRVARL